MFWELSEHAVRIDLCPNISQLLLADVAGARPPYGRGLISAAAEFGSSNQGRLLRLA
jgi:hypothetical protein